MQIYSSLNLLHIQLIQIRFLFDALEYFQERVHINRTGVQCHTIADVRTDDKVLNLDSLRFFQLRLASRSPNLAVTPPYSSVVFLIDTDSESLRAMAHTAYPPLTPHAVNIINLGMSPSLHI